MKEKTLTTAGSVVIIVLLITSATALISNSKNKLNFNNEEIQFESLPSEKLQSTQDLNKAKSDLVAIKSQEESSSAT
jgi:hypothetical protein